MTIRPASSTGLRPPSIADRAERQKQRGQGNGVDFDDPQDGALRGTERKGDLLLGDVQPGTDAMTAISA
jgi:hypothetical protein